MKEKRNTSIELLRIIAMFMIIGSHLTYHGVQHNASDNVFINYNMAPLFNRIFSELLIPGGEVGVNIFFLITGYFSIKKQKINFLALRNLLIEGSFYGLLCLFLLILIKLCGFSFFQEFNIVYFQWIMKSIFDPSLSGAWWFLSAYIILILISPLINKLFNTTNVKGQLLFLLFIFIFPYGFGKIAGSDYLYLSRAFLFYGIGGFINKNLKSNSIKSNKVIYLLAFILVWTLSGMISFTINNILNTNESVVQLINRLLSCIEFSILNPLAAIALFITFLSLDFNSKMINNIAKSVFGIYLIHDSLLGRKLLWEEVFNLDKLFFNQLFPFYSVIIIGLIFLGCLVIDYLRNIYFVNCVFPVVNKVTNNIIFRLKE